MCIAACTAGCTAGPATGEPGLEGWSGDPGPWSDPWAGAGLWPLRYSAAG